MDRKQELTNYLNHKREAVEFWQALRGNVKLECKIALLEKEVKEAHDEIVKIRRYC